MSVENAFEFMKKVSEDSQLQSEIDKLIAGKEGKEADAAVAEVAKNHGCEFTADESFQARSAVKQQLIKDGKIDDELSDEELESVAGGGIVVSEKSAVPAGIRSLSSFGGFSW